LLDVYGHFLPSEYTGYADALLQPHNAPYAHPEPLVPADTGAGAPRLNRAGERKASSGRPSPDATERCAVQSYFLGLLRLMQTKPQPPSACGATALVRKPGSRPPACAV